MSGAYTLVGDWGIMSYVFMAGMIYVVIKSVWDARK